MAPASGHGFVLGVKTSPREHSRAVLRSIIHRDRTGRRPHPLSEISTNTTKVLQHSLSVEPVIRKHSKMIDTIKELDERGEILHDVLFGQDQGTTYPSDPKEYMASEGAGIDRQTRLARHDQLKADFEAFTRHGWSEWANSTEGLNAAQRRESYREFRTGRVHTWEEEFRLWRQNTVGRHN